MRLHPIQLQPRHSLSGAAVLGQRAIRPTGFRRQVSHRAGLPVSETAPALHDLQPCDVFRELLQEKQLPSDELSAVFDELLALREARVLV